MVVPTTLDALQTAPRDEPTGTSVQYTSAYLAAAKASTPSLHPSANASGIASTPNLSMQLDTAQSTVIPSEQAVEAAKQRRAQAIKHAEGDDFVSLDAGGESSHRLRGTGSDSDEFDAFVADEQALGLSRQARRQNAEEERKRIARTLENVHLGSGDTDDDAEEEMAWEAAQLAKFQDTMPPPESAQSTRDKYVPAPIPEERAVPALSAPHTALRVKLAEVKGSISGRNSIIHDARKSLFDLENELRANRTALEASAKKSAWFAELGTFVKDLDSFLAAKFPLLLDLEREVVALARNEAAKGVQSQAAVLDRLIGPNAPSTWPTPPIPAEEGLSAIEPNAQRRALKARWDLMWSDVDAPEFRSAVAGLPDLQAPASMRDSPVPESDMQSLVGRFATWRAQYPEEYMAAWGGLSLAQAWSFWARSDVLSMLLVSCEAGGLPPARTLLSQPWLKQARAYADGVWPTAGASGQHIGGDEEVVQVLLREAILVPLANVVSGHVPDDSGAQPPSGWNLWDKDANAHLALVMQGMEQAGAEAADVQALALVALEQAEAWVRPLSQATVRAKAQVAKALAALLAAIWPWLSLLLASSSGEAGSESGAAAAVSALDSLVSSASEGLAIPELQDLLRDVPAAAVDCLPHTRARISGAP